MDIQNQTHFIIVYSPKVLFVYFMFKIARNELKIFRSDKRALMLTFILPIALISLFALAFGGAGKSSGDKEYNLLVSDLDNSTESKHAIAELDSDKNIRVLQEQYEKAQDLVKKGKEDAVLVFHKGFSDSMQNGNKLPMELQYDEARQAEIGMLQQSLIPNLFRLTGAQGMKKKLMKQVNPKYSGFVQNWFDSIGTLISANYDEKKTASSKTDSATSEKNGWNNMMGGIEMTKLVAAKEDNTVGLVQAVAGTAVMMLLFSVAAMGASILTEKEEGTLKKLLTSPIHPNQILFGKMISANVVAVLQLTIMMVYAWILFGLNLFQNIPALVIIILATAFACSSFGMLLASVAKSRSQVQGLSTLIVLTMSAIGGSMVPSFLMPEWMQKVAVVSVNYWSIQGFYDIFWRQLAVTDFSFLLKIAVLVGMGITLTFLAMKMFQRNALKLY